MRSILQLKRVQTEKANKNPPTNSSQGAKRNLTVDFRKFFNQAQKTQTPHFFQQYLRKMQLLSLENPLSDEKDSKSVKKRLKKGLTRGRNRDIITELSTRATSPPDGTDPWKRYRIKKNANCDFHESQLRKRQSIREWVLNLGATASRIQKD